MGKGRRMRKGWRRNVYEKQCDSVGGKHNCRKPTPGMGGHGTGAGELLQPDEGDDVGDWLGHRATPKGERRSRHCELSQLPGTVAPPPAQCDAKYCWLGGRSAPLTTTGPRGVVAVRSTAAAALGIITPGGTTGGTARAAKTTGGSALIIVVVVIVAALATTRSLVTGAAMVVIVVLAAGLVVCALLGLGAARAGGASGGGCEGVESLGRAEGGFK